MVNFATILISLSALTGSALATAGGTTTTKHNTIAWDPYYDGRTNLLGAKTACPPRAPKLHNKYETFADLPSFPLIGGFPEISAYNSESCGSCFNVTYEGKTISVLAIDNGRGVVNLGEKAMDRLTNGGAKELGRVQGEYVEVEGKFCGL